MIFLSRTFTRSVQKRNGFAAADRSIPGAKSWSVRLPELSQSTAPDCLDPELRPLKIVLPSEPIPSAARTQRVMSGAAVQQWQT